MLRSKCFCTCATVALTARLRVAVAVLGAASLVAGLAGPAYAQPAATTRAAVLSAGHDQGAVRRELQRALDDVVAAGASGMTLRVDDGRRSYRLASGQARLGSARSLRPAARLRVGSITKTFVSTVTLQLVAERRLTLNDTVERWQPGLIPGGASITVRQLLNHTSGIFNYTDDQAFVQQLLSHPLRAVTPQQLVDVANAHPPVFPPGTSWSYSNTNYIVMGLILQRVTHRPVSTLLRQRIIWPLGLRHTYLPERSPDIRGYHAHGYLPPSITGQGYVDFTRISPSLAWTAGALVSNVGDLRRFYRALLGGRLLRPAQLAQMKDLVPVGDGLGYGLGLYSLPTPCGRIWGHDGGIPGYVTIAWNDESGRRGITVGLPTLPDERIGTAFNRLLEVATCRAMGQAPTVARPAASGQVQDTWVRRVDGS